MNKTVYGKDTTQNEIDEKKESSAQETTEKSQKQDMKISKITYMHTDNEDFGKPNNNYDDEKSYIYVEAGMYDFGDWLNDNDINYEKTNNKYYVIDYSGERTGEVYYIYDEEQLSEEQLKELGITEESLEESFNVVPKASRTDNTKSEKQYTSLSDIKMIDKDIKEATAKTQEQDKKPQRGQEI